MHIRHLLILALCITFLSGCYNPFSNFLDLFDGDGDGNDDRNASPDRVIEATDQFALAIGGVASGRDELVIYNDAGDIRSFDGQTLVCTAEDNIVHIGTRPGYTTAAEGSGVLLTAIEPGVTAVHCTVDDAALSAVYEITIPPQSLIQILVAEGALPIAEEAELDEEYEDEDVVMLDSVSPTASALGAVIRNRIDRINMNDDPGLFNADEEDYDADAPASYYDAVIYAEDQFEPTDRENAAYEIFSDAQDRNFLEDDWRIAYDQAVITAAGIFNRDIADPTTGAFGFRSPTEGEWSVIQEGLWTHTLETPDGAGFSDASFPSLAPIQLLILPDAYTYEDGRPAFVYARKRTSSDFAVTNQP